MCSARHEQRDGWLTVGGCVVLAAPGGEPHVRFMAEALAAGDPIPAQCAIIEVHVADLKQLFNTIDPTPFRDRDLDPDVDKFIVEWAREAPADKPLVLLVHLDRASSTSNEAVVARDSIHTFFARRASASRAKLRRLFRYGRISLMIGLAVLTLLIVLAQLIGRVTSDAGLGRVLHESLLIGGWVAMWRPLEVFLYDWWPIRAEARLFDRLAAMPVQLRYVAAGGSPG